MLPGEERTGTAPARRRRVLCLPARETWSRALNALVVTADDFGLAEEVNDAVEAAHRNGILSAADLMVVGPAAGHALALARRMPDLRLGLHLVLVGGEPALPPDQIRNLVGRDGMLPDNMMRAGFNLLRPKVRRQMQREIAAQFEAFRKTGHALDHVSAHKHFHLHPLVASDLLAIGRRFGMKAVRVPVEPVGALRGAEPDGATRRPNVALPWAGLLRARARGAGFKTADAVFGLRWTGRMTTDRLRGLLERLPDGLVEIYTHPATRNDFPGHAVNCRYVDELAALTDPAVADAVRSSGRRLGGYADAT
jgi:hopanoid biosynthesis associated protein HpnK